MCYAFVQKVRRPEVSKRIAPIQSWGRLQPPSTFPLPVVCTLLKRPGLFECQPHTRLCPSFSRLTLDSSSRHKVFSILFSSHPLDGFATLLSPPLSLSLSVTYTCAHIFSLSSLPSFLSFGHTETNIAATEKERERGSLQSLMGLLLDRGSAFKTQR